MMSKSAIFLDLSQFGLEDTVHEARTDRERATVLASAAQSRLVWEGGVFVALTVLYAIFHAASTWYMWEWKDGVAITLWIFTTFLSLLGWLIVLGSNYKYNSEDRTAIQQIRGETFFIEWGMKVFWVLWVTPHWAFRRLQPTYQEATYKSEFASDSRTDRLLRLAEGIELVKQAAAANQLNEIQEGFVDELRAEAAELRRSLGHVSLGDEIQLDNFATRISEADINT